MIKPESAHIEEVRDIRKLDIDFRKGTFAISGPNGSGKSGVIDDRGRRVCLLRAGSPVLQSEDTKVLISGFKLFVGQFSSPNGAAGKLDTALGHRRRPGCSRRPGKRSRSC